jgi:hypothetical protein
VPGPVTERLGEAAREHGTVVNISVHERERGTLYDTTLTFGPDGALLAGPVHDEETILTADLDLARIPEESLALDVTGHSARHLHVRTEALRHASRRRGRADAVRLHSTMRTAALILLLPLLPAAAQEDDETFVDKETGLVIEVPEGWTRETNRESDAVRFAAVYDFTTDRYVLFTVEVGSAADYDEDAWLKVERAALKKAMKEVVKPFETESIEVAGQLVDRYTMAGTIASGTDKAYEMHVRACGVVEGDFFFKVSEVSYNKAREKAEDPVRAMWAAIRFDPEAVEGPDTAPIEGEPQAFKDSRGNFELTLPPGWHVKHGPPDKANTRLRLRVVREAADGSSLIDLYVLRRLTTRAVVFSVETPGDRLQAIRRRGFFEQFYGKGSADFIRPDMDARALLGGLEKSGGYEFRSITMDEDQRVREAQKLRNRGDQSVKVPEYADLVIRGRLAMLSPYVYHATAVFDRAVSDDEQVLAEYRKVLDSWRFLDKTPIPQPLVTYGHRAGDTTADPKLREKRKEEHVHVVESRRRAYKLKLEYELPPGFRCITKKLPEKASLLVVAQDAKNNWVKIYIHHMNLTAWGDDHPNKILGKGRKDICETWRSNWTSKARGVKRMKKPRSVRLGRSVDGDGYKLVEGEVEGFRGTFTGVATQESTWWSFFEMETRGDGDKVFKNGIKAFFRSLRVEKE